MKENSQLGKHNLKRIIGPSQRSFRENMKVALSLWGALSIVARWRLKELTEDYRLSIAAGDLQLLGGVWYITHAGLLRIACRKRCTGIRATLVDHRCDPSSQSMDFQSDRL